MKEIGKWAFLLGLLIAVVIGAIKEFPYAGLILLVLGAVIGFINIDKKNNTNFMITVLTLLAVVTVSNLVQIDTVIPQIGSILQAIIINVAVFVAPAALIVCLKEIYNLASGRK